MKSIATVSIMIAAATSMAQTAGRPQTRVFVSEEMGLQFTFPAAWKLENKRVQSVVTFPLEGSKLPAVVEIFAVTWSKSASDWQTLQATTAEAVKRTLERQSEEQILGVPLLLTKTSYFTKDGRAMTTETGLLYSRSARKFQYRIAAPASVFESAQREWRQALETLRPIGDELPKPEDPSLPPLEATKGGEKAKIQRPIVKNPDVVRPPVTLNNPAKSGSRIVAQKNLYETSAGGKTLLVYLPAGWTSTPQADGTTLLTSPNKLALRCDVYSKLDSRTPEVETIVRTSKSLEQFKSVDKREDRLPLIAPSGASVAWVRRDGQLKTGEPTTQLVVTGDCGDYYWVVEFACAGPTAYTQIRKELDDLLAKLAVEPKP